MELTGATRERLDDAGKLLLRVTVAGLMLFHGIDKVLHGLGTIRADLTRGGFPEAMAYGAFIGELGAPILILLGLWTRPAALVYAGTNLFAVLLVHAGDFARIAPSGGWAAELWVFYFTTAITVALLGAGRYSIRRGRHWLD